MFSTRVSVFSLLCAVFLLVACSDSSNGGNAGPCASDSPPAECDAVCDDSTPCPGGYYCGNDGTCNADCSAGGDECDDGEVCDGTGQCVPGGDDDDGSDDDGANDDDGGDDGCPAVEVNLTPVVPLVTLLLDQSGSMNDPFPPAPDRWEALRTALIGTNDDGVLFQLQSSLDMGATLYTYDSEGTATCPELQEVPQAINNADAIANVLENNEPVDDTPTAESMDAVVASFPASSDRPRVIVLATDGNPDNCVDPAANDNQPDPVSQALSETAVQNAFDAGLETFVLSIGDDTEESHLQRLANAGQGLDLATGDAEFYLALGPAALVDAFEEIVGGIRSCQIDIDGSVELDRAPEGTVILNGEELTYETDWVMVDDDTLELVGAACDEFLGAESVALSAEFPCGGVVVD
jgi:von Willebrand factor type A domain